MKKYTVELTKEQLNQLGIKIEPEFIYPLFKKWSYTGEIIKFTSMTEGIVIWKGNGDNLIGHTFNTFTEHTNNLWEDVAYNKERDLWDKQPVECWDNGDTHQRVIRFYDVKNKNTFTYSGEREGVPFNNYKPISSNKLDKWILDAYKTLEK